MEEDSSSLPPRPARGLRSGRRDVDVGGKFGRGHAKGGEGGGIGDGERGGEWWSSAFRFRGTNGVRFDGGGDGGDVSSERERSRGASAMIESIVRR